MNNLSQVFQPRFINLDYFFAKFFELLDYLIWLLFKVVDWLSHQIFLSIALSSIFFICLIFVVINILRLRTRRKKHLSHFVTHEESPKERTVKWENIEKKILSDNPNDWREAIIAVDNLIDTIIQKIGYKEGESMTERLRSIEPSDFDSLKDVWEAHQIKIKIVKEGESYPLTQEEAKEVLEKYKKALKELKYI